MLDRVCMLMVLVACNTDIINTTPKLYTTPINRWMDEDEKYDQFDSSPFFMSDDDEATSQQQAD